MRLEEEGEGTAEGAEKRSGKILETFTIPLRFSLTPPNHASTLEYCCVKTFRGNFVVPTQNVVLTDQQAAFIETMVAAGKYQNASEVVREGLRLIEQRETDNAVKLNELREAIQLGLDSFERGEYDTFETAESLALHLQTLAAQAKAEVGADTNVQHE